MITTEQAIAIARECGGSKGANIKGGEFCIANWCSEPNGECDCEEREVQCAKPTKGVYLSYNALTALCNLAYAKGVEDAGKWISVNHALPEKDSLVLAWVRDDDNRYGGYIQVVEYGYFEWYDYDDAWDDADEDGLVRRFGWNYGRESEGEFDYLTFDLNGKVTHWMPLPPAPKGQPE